MYDTFKYDLAFGETIESEFADWAINEGLTVTKMHGKFSEYDFILTDPDNSETLTVELKSDRQALTTGNVALELHKVRDGVQYPAGLSVSTADTFVFKLVGMKGFYSIPTERIREIVRLGKNYITIFSGDFKASYTALFNRDWFLKQCQPHNLIQPNE